jgi:hypothetical protein
MAEQNLPITAEQFEEILEQISAGVGLNRCCKKVGISIHSLYKYLTLVGASAEQRYARARSEYIEAKLCERDSLNEKCIKELRSCEPKRVHAIQNYYKELARQIEWELGRLKPDKYGDKVEVNNNIRTPTALKVNIIDPKSNG